MPLAGQIPTKCCLLPGASSKFTCKLRAFELLFQDADEEGHVRSAVSKRGKFGARAGAVRLRGSVVFDKSFVIMALACAVAPIVGAGIYVMVHLF